MTLYAILHRPIGRIAGWAIPDHIAKTSPLAAPGWSPARARQYVEREKNARYRRLLDAIALQVSPMTKAEQIERLQAIATGRMKPRPRRIKQSTLKDTTT